MNLPIAEDTATQALPMRLFRGAGERRHVRRMREQLGLVEAGLLDHLRFASSVADAPARYLAEAGGKRIRPMLTLLTSELGDGPGELVRRAAQAVELTHLASLYHDDVMDDAKLRRGVPAAQMVWSNSVAILAGDLLFARASTLVSGMGEEAILLQARTFERLCLGQLHETIGPQDGDDPMEHYLQVLADKTGALIATAARMGVMFSGAPGAFADPVTEYGERIGVAFQLVDDVIDLSPKAERTGKRAGTDLRAGVITMPLLRLRELAAGGDAEAAELSERIGAGVARIAAGEDPALLDPEVEALRAHPVTAQTELAARDWARDAVAALDPLPKSTVKRGLELMAESIVNREG
ncbi:polyprenyl synthetase family protein [Leucobacter weissii]|uniref:Polyprenyl synthetase family protein n=1 Tax=Leucobacter weissii TaxID=1983706 RepID=A0A939MJW3_9MICO|nr:polyprenyl synthetase family protein [Leucobacter weissii]MBO1901580.1 polyprenyl synthetase family protein [Leucobacter weissii]